MKKLLILILFAAVFHCADLFAANRYWVGTTNNNWNNTGNWSTSSGGASGASVPGSGDVAHFDGNGLVDCTIDANVNVSGLQVAAGYTMTITHTTNTITIGTSGATLSGGTFSGGSGNITLTGAFTISGCAFTSTSGTFSTNSNFTYSSGSFAHNSGRVKFTATNTVTGSLNLYDLEYAPTSSATFTITSGTTLTASNLFTCTGSSSITLNTGNIDASGAITMTNTSTSGGGTATITVNGGSNQTWTGTAQVGEMRLPHVVINKSGGTLTLSNYLSVEGNWTYTAGTISAGSSTVTFIGTKTISGTHSLNNVTFNGTVGSVTYTIASGSTLTIAGTLLTTGSSTITINTGDIHAQGHLTLSNTSSSSGGTATVTINGSGNQTMSGGSTVGEARMPNMVINKSSGTLTLSGVISVAGNWTYTAGTISAGSSTVFFATTKTISGTHSLNNVSFSGGGAYTYTLDGSSTLTVLGNLSFSGSGAITLNTGTIHAKGDVMTTNSSTSTGGTATIVVNDTGSQTLTGSGTAGAGKLPNITIDKPSGTLTLSSIISCTGNWIYSQGTVSPGTSSVALYGTFNLDGQGTSGDVMPFYRVQVSTGTRTLTGSIDANDNFTISSGATCVAGSYTITVGGNWNSQGTWTANTGTVVFDGTGHNSIRGVAGTIVFANVVINRDAVQKSVTLGNPVQINTSMTLQKGRVKTSSANYLAFVDDATCTVTNNDSAYVHGPVRKTGNDAFTFPLGDTTLPDNIAYHPISITAPSNNSDRFEATYRATGQTCGTTKASTLNTLSSCEYWIVDRQFGSSTPTVTLGWNSNCDNTAFSEMRVAEWTGAQWTDRGQASTSITHPTGSVTASSALSFASDPDTLTVAYVVVDKAYGVLTKSQPAGGYHSTDGYVLYFGFDDEYDDQNDSLSFAVIKLSNDRAQTLMPNSANRPLVYYGMNRYKLDLYDNANTPLPAGYYMLEVTNSRNEKWYLRFKI